MENNIKESNDNLNKNSSSRNDNNIINITAVVTQIYLSINDKKNQECKSKCTSMILDFIDAPQDVGEIVFKNYYTYTISVLVMKISYADPNRLKKWYIAIEKKVFKIDISIMYLIKN